MCTQIPNDAKGLEVDFSDENLFTHEIIMIIIVFCKIVKHVVNRVYQLESGVVLEIEHGVVNW